MDQISVGYTQMKRKLTDKEIEEILDSKMHPIDLARKYKISRPHVYNCRRGSVAKSILKNRELQQQYPELFVFPEKE